MRNTTWIAIVVAGSAAACSFPGNPAGGDGPIFADSASADAAIPDAVCAGSYCNASTLVLCTGENISCDHNCAATPSPHCRQLVPTNLGNANDLTNVTGALDADARGGQNRWYIYTDDGEIQYEDGSGFHQFRAGGESIINGIGFRRINGTGTSVLTVDTFTVRAGVTVRGSGRNALIILSRNAVQVLGVVDFSGGRVSQSNHQTDPTGGGPGGGDGENYFQNSSGCADGSNGDGGNGNRKESGGGGGGFGGDGADGGDSADHNGGNGGNASDCDGDDLTPLIGGSGGGFGYLFEGGGPGGGGGGAIQISSLIAITIGSTGVVDAGGEGGLRSTSSDGGGGGGGSGGGILLEAPTIVIDGVVAANGGGGGSGRSSGGSDGSPGSRSATPAPGGSGGSGGGGAGGAEGANAQQGDDTDDGGGGGGGGVGKILIISSAVPGGTISPAPQTALPVYE